MKQVVALGLFSGGLDSILACRVIAEQGVKVVALKFVTPFFDYGLLEKKEAYVAEMEHKYGINVELVDLSEGYLDLLRKPIHGFGKNFNPCIDCKILMLTRAKELMAQYNASFLVTGEVMGQRPMSQRRDTLRLIERDAGCTGLLLRPLSAKLLPATVAEQEGLVDREQLFGFSGRGRKPQRALAKALGIEDYPNAAGGCILTDCNLGGRIGKYYSGAYTPDSQDISVADVNLLLVGRQFLLFDKYWLVVGRDEKENNRVASFWKPGDWLFAMTTHPGPTALLRFGDAQVDAQNREAAITACAGIAVAYSKKVNGKAMPAEVSVTTGKGCVSQTYKPLAGSVFQPWRIE